MAMQSPDQDNKRIGKFFNKEEFVNLREVLDICRSTRHSVARLLYLTYLAKSYYGQVGSSARLSRHYISHRRRFRWRTVDLRLLCYYITVAERDQTGLIYSLDQNIL